jgi:hypothetical protein
MLGDVAFMDFLVGDSSEDFQGFMFPVVSGIAAATHCNTETCRQQAVVKTLDVSVGMPFEEASEFPMTSISATSTSFLSPLQQLQKELQAELTSGKISSTDKDALSSALTDIDSSLQGSRSSGSASKASPDDMKSKIDDLIAGEVSSGKLTSDQATELKDVFKTAFAGGPGGAGGAGGPPPGPPPSDSTDSTSSTSGTDSSSGTSVSDILQQFLKTLQDQLSAASTSYSASGTTATGTTASGSFSALLIDYQT